ncbi:MAG: HD domain-containing protein [Clostridiaceae bacterium]|nr:HD domain-containing protein [Clostridiaceae bacterium]
MRKTDYALLETYMLSCMGDSAHDKDHIYRVLYVALDIAGRERDVDYDVLIAACLLHDIGRGEQFANPALCHAAIGADMAYHFLTAHGYSADCAGRVAQCIRVHRFRNDNPPAAIEEKILFDADKVEASGAIGIARTLLYNGRIGEPLYSLTDDGEVSDGTADISPSFFEEYKHKLERLYGKFFTERGREIARERQHTAIAFYDSLFRETAGSYRNGLQLLSHQLEG